MAAGRVATHGRCAGSLRAPVRKAGLTWNDGNHPRRHPGRVAFGYQVQTVASLGPDLIAAFSIDLASLGTLMGVYLLPGALAALPTGFLARFWGDRNVVAAGLALMVLGSLLSAAATGAAMLGAGRMMAGAGAWR